MCVCMYVCVCIHAWGHAGDEDRRHWPQLPLWTFAVQGGVLRRPRYLSVNCGACILGHVCAEAGTFLIFSLFYFAVRAVFPILIARLLLGVVVLKKVETKILKSARLVIFTLESHCTPTFENLVLAGVFGRGCAKEAAAGILVLPVNTHTHSRCHMHVYIAAAGILILPRQI